MDTFFLWVAIVGAPMYIYKTRTIRTYLFLSITERRRSMIEAAQLKADSISAEVARRDKYASMPLTAFLAKMPDIPTDDCLERLGYNLPNWMTHQSQSLADGHYLSVKQQEAVQEYRAEFIDKGLIEKFRMESHHFATQRKEMGKLQKRKQMAAAKAAHAANNAAAASLALVDKTKEMIIVRERRLHARSHNLELAHTYASKQSLQLGRYQRGYNRPRTSTQK